jgi:hypothetical protein
MGQETEAQYCFQFEESAEPKCSTDSDHTDRREHGVAHIFSFAEKQSQKESEREGRLYEGILERVKHLYS